MFPLWVDAQIRPLRQVSQATPTLLGTIAEERNASLVSYINQGRYTVAVAELH